MKKGHWRPFRPVERKLFERLFEKQFSGRDELVKQLDGMLVRQIDDNGSLELKIASPVYAPVSRRVPVEAQYIDSDGRPSSEVGPFVHVLLHTKDGQMTELEIYKDDGSPIVQSPDPNNLDVLLY